MNKTDEELLVLFLEHVKREGLVVNYVQITREGKLSAEYCRIGKTRLQTWSLAKGVVSCAAGIAVDEGLVALDEKIADIFPEYLPKEPSELLRRITIDNLLTMSCGLEKPLFFGDDPEKYRAKDWIRTFFSAPFAYEPGTHWQYSNFNTYMVSCAIERRAGCNLLEYLRNRLFEPIGIGNPEWTLCPMGHVYAANGLYLTIDELSAFGRLILNQGTFDGRDIVPSAYMKKATSRLIDNSCLRTEDNKAYSGYGYGYQFLMNPNDGFRSEGKFGQFCIAVPRSGTVVAVMSLDDKAYRIGTLLFEDIIGSL